MALFFPIRTLTTYQQVNLYGSLAATGEGHSTPLALVLGLGGHRPDTVDPSTVREQVAKGVLCHYFE
jgi:L-serine dehydratase